MRSAGTRRAGPWVLLAVLVLVVVALTRPTGEGLPFDARGTGPSGARGLVLLLEEFGASVEIDVGPEEIDDVDVALLLVDQLTEERRDRLAAWVHEGGTLVLGDPRSLLAPEVAGPAAAGFVLAPLSGEGCRLGALAEVDEIAPSSQALAFDAISPAVGCFPAASGPWLVAEPRGDGLVVALGSPDVWTNARLGVADHAVLATSLLLPAAGARVVVVPSRAEGEAPEVDLGDLVPDSVVAAALQALVALLLYALWRARRLGHPVREDQPVALPASELVVAAGRMSQRAHHGARASRTIAEAARRDTARRLGLDRDADDVTVAGAATSAGVEPAVVDAALHPPDDPVAAARAADELHAAVVAVDGGHPSTPTPSPTRTRSTP